MATDVERLVVQLSADFKQYQNALNRATGVTNRSARQIETRFAQMNRNVSSGFLGLSRGMVAAFAAGASLRGAQQLIDTSIKIQNALKVTGLEGQALSQVYNDLFASAQKNAAPLESLVQLYSRIALAQNELGVSSQEITRFTDTVGMALRVQGTSSQEASGALLQLSQALAEGIVRSQEFNSLIEGTPSILRAAAVGIAEAEGSVAKLRQIMLDGELSSQAFFRGIQAGSHILEDQLAGAETTVAQAFIRLQNVLQDTAGELNQGTEASEKLAGAIEWLADAIATADFGPIVDGLERMANTAAEVIGFVDRLGAALGRLTGLDQVGEYARRNIAQNDINDRINDAFGDTGPGDKGDRPTALPALEVKADKPKITLADYPVGAGADGGSGKGGGGGKSTRERADEYQRLAERIDQSTASLVAETEVQRQLNPLIDDYGYALEKARAEQDLLNAAKEAGKEVTPQLRSEIAALAEQYALATQEAGKLAESQDDIRDRAEDMRDFQKDLTRGIVDGFIEGKNAADIFADALSKIGNKLLDLAFDTAFGGGSSGGGGWLGNLLTSLIPGRQHGGSVQAGQPYIVGEKRPELFVPSTSGTIVPRVPTMPNLRGAGGGGSVSAPVTVHIDARGADREGLARVEAQVARLKSELPATVVKTVREANKSNVKMR